MPRQARFPSARIDVSERALTEELTLRGARPLLVGRTAETQALWWALGELQAGRGVVVELTGDPGIGKTRLLAELADEAGRRGIPVLKGDAAEFERDLPFQVFVDALAGRYRRGAAPDAVPQLAALFSGLGAPGSGAERFRVYGAVRDMLADWARPGGMLLLLDDMHWADPGAAELAEHLVRRPPDAPLLLVIAQRARQSQPRLAGTLARGVELGSVVRLEVGPLSPAECAELAGDGLDDAALRDICAESGGNPLYLLTAAAARRSAPWVALVPGAGMPPGSVLPGLPGGSLPRPMQAAPGGESLGRLEAVLLAELAPLTAAESTVAAAGAVIGQQFSIDALPPVAGLGQREVMSAVGGLTRRDVLRPTSALARLAFRHPVLRRLVYQTADPAWRAAAHRRALAELERRGAPAAELAHHVAASPRGDVRADVGILMAAAHAAMSSAPAAAAHWLRVTLEILPDDQAHAQQRLEILLLLTRALGVAGRAAESRDLLHEILRLVPLRPPGPRVAAVTFCATMERLLARYADARALLTAELASPRAAATGEGVGLAIEYGTVALLTGDFPSARAALADAVARARRRGNRVRAAYALANTGFGEVYEGNIETSGKAVDAAAALVDTLSDGELYAEPECLNALGWAEFFLERYPDAERHFARGVAINRHIGHYHVLPHLLLGQCQLAGWRGPLTRSIALSEEAEEIARHIDSADLLGFAFGLRSFALAWRGGPVTGKRAVELAEQAVQLTSPASVWWRRVAAIMHAIALLLDGDPARCTQVMRDAGGGAGLPLMQPSLRPACFDLLTGAAVLSGDNAAARDCSQRADAESRRLGLAGQRGFALRSRAFLLSATGRHADAAAAFREAADLLGVAGIRVGQAWALAFGAPSALAAGRPEAALAMADEARSLAQAAESLTILGAAEDTRRRIAVGQDGPGRAGDPLAVLTVREREIAELAAAGRASRDIAAQLSLSPRTVDTHLSHVYRKLGVPSRAALASMVAGGSGLGGY
jgi:DNA-binding CsgD family transcriptional regulator